MKKVYLATNGDDYNWRVEAIFATREEADRYVAMFSFAEEVEEWDVGVKGLPDDPDVLAWTCSFDDRGEELTCRLGATSSYYIGLIQGWKWANRMVAVYAKTEGEAMRTALEIIEAKDGPHATWGDPQWGTA